MRDPEWLPDDVEDALVWAAAQDEHCAGCGQPIAESMDPASERAYEAEPLVCHSCRTRDRSQRAHADQGGDLDGLYMTVRKKPPS